MNFLYPQFLFGLLALSIPIIVHLFNFRRTKRIYFSNNLFLKNVKEVSSSKLRLKHLLILMARLLFIFFLVIAFAQPFISGEKEELKNELVYVYLDNSFSMSNEVATDLRAVDQGVGFINDLVDIYPQNTKFKFITNNFESSSNLLKSKNEIKEVLSEMALSSVSRSLEEINNRQSKDKLNFNNETKDIFWITDFQRSTSGKMEEISFDSSGRYYLVPLNYQNLSNVYIDSVYLDNPFLLENEKNKLNVSIHNSGSEEVLDLPLKLFVGDTQVANASVNIEPESRGLVSFELNQSLSRINKGRISFEEFPVTFDNDFYFTLNVDKKINVLEIKSNDTGSSLADVYANQNLFSLSSFLVNNIDYSYINTSDLIVLNEISNISSSLHQALIDFLDQGGSLLVIPSLQLDLSSYRGLVDLRMNVVGLEDEKYELRTPDFSNPFFADIFIETDEVFEMPLAKNVILLNSPNQALLTLRNREGYLSELIGNRKVYVLGTPLKDQFTSFHQHALFVPVMYRIASLSSKSNDQLYYSLNQSSVTLKIDSIVKNSVYKLIGNDQELIPAQRIMGNELRLELPKYTLKTGYYDLTLNDQLIKVLSFNHDKKESLIAQYFADDLNSLIQDKRNVKLYNARDNNDFTSTLKEAHAGVPLWKYSLIIALLFLLAEILFIRYL
ncbi:BatA domain-containing protein [Fulvivirgaceae bacterium BMA10]|uniref:BatA domain-containing protein n=1 Tax=Splendidivirga corallicola TaxID=3051826 RepID=A0ABT8KJG5_9BACT|nr:BatA domain-containing protein [Fulvivirgaceae bacterium BMA10]